MSKKKLESLWDRCSFAWVAIEQEKMLNFDCLKLWLIISLTSKNSIIYDSEFHHHYIAIWCMSQKRYIYLYENCLYNKIKFSIDRFSYNTCFTIFLIVFNLLIVILSFFCHWIQVLCLHKSAVHNKLWVWTVE